MRAHIRTCEKYIDKYGPLQELETTGRFAFIPYNLILNSYKECNGLGKINTFILKIFMDRLLTIVPEYWCLFGKSNHFKDFCSTLKTYGGRELSTQITHCYNYTQLQTLGRLAEMFLLRKIQIWNAECSDFFWTLVFGLTGSGSRS